MPEMEEILSALKHPAASVILIFACSWFIHRLVKRSVLKLKDTSYIQVHTAHRIVASIRAGLFVVAAIATLQATGIIGEAWAIVSAAIAALAVGFVATWSLLSNITAAVLVLIFRPFRVGDRIQILESDKIVVEGIVLDLNLAFTTVQDHSMACRIPNNLLFQRVVRVSRAGKAPDPAEDASAPFFE
jgi:small-conductance mechanosensitive channel